MPKANLYNMSGKQIGEVELSEVIFGVEPNQCVIHDVVKNHLANCRQGTQSALTRAEVSGGGRKPWRQKGTGRARQGSTRAPQWTPELPLHPEQEDPSSSPKVRPVCQGCRRQHLGGGSAQHG